MKCPHCGIDFDPEHHSEQIALPSFVENPGYKYGEYAENIRWDYRATACTACRGIIVSLAENVHTGQDYRQRSLHSVFPKGTNRSPTPKEVPQKIRVDYEEACQVLALSPKASAALARRCLQAILREQGYAQNNLVDQIDAALNETDARKALPPHICDAMDAVRHFGNFSAHPMTDITALQIIDVESGEAEWCLEILEHMFDHYYVRPAQIAARKAALNTKLQKAGKKPAK